MWYRNGLSHYEIMSHCAVRAVISRRSFATQYQHLAVSVLKCLFCAGKLFIFSLLEAISKQTVRCRSPTLLPTWQPPFWERDWQVTKTITQRSVWKKETQKKSEGSLMPIVVQLFSPIGSGSLKPNLFYWQQRIGFYVNSTNSKRPPHIFAKEFRRWMSDRCKS